MLKLILYPIIAVVFLCVSISNVKAQQNLDYTPMLTYDETSYDLIDSVRTIYKQELRKLRSPIAMRQFRTKILKLFLLIEEGAFIDDPAIQDMTNRIASRITEGNDLTTNFNYIFVSKDPSVNAFSLGHGLIIINIGLIRQMKSEGNLAFIVAHEMAHNELNSPFDDFEMGAKNDRKKAIRYTSEINEDENSLEDLSVIQSLLYDSKKFSRFKEKEADSLGFILFKNADYCDTDAVDALSYLDLAKNPKYPQGEFLLEPFYFGAYPLQPHWIRSRPKGFARLPKMLLVYDVDSLNTHPHIADRIASLNTSFTNCQTDFGINNEIQNIFEKADFENVEAALYQSKYDIALYQCVQLKRKYPNNIYVNTTITEILIELSIAKSKGTFKNYINNYVMHFHDELKEINAFLFNLNEIELGELAYRYISEANNFNIAVGQHYELKIKAAKLTNRREVKKRLQAQYDQKFNSIYAQSEE